MKAFVEQKNRIGRFQKTVNVGASEPGLKLLETMNGHITSFLKALSSLEAETSAKIKLSAITYAKIGKVFHGCDPIFAAPFRLSPPIFFRFPISPFFVLNLDFMAVAV